MEQNEPKKGTSDVLIVAILIVLMCLDIKGINVMLSGVGIPDNVIGLLAIGLAFYIKPNYIDKWEKTEGKTYNITRFACLGIVCNMILLGTGEVMLGNGRMLLDGKLNGILAIVLAYLMENAYFSRLKEKTQNPDTE